MNRDSIIQPISYGEELNMSRITVLVGSPRKGGNTEMLADAFIKGAEQAGHEIVKIHLRERKVNGCFGCDYCTKNDGKCVQKDDMQSIYDELYHTDILVLATPIYYFGITAQLKTVIDRFYPSLTKPFSATSAVFLVTYGDESSTEADMAIAHYRTIVSRGLGLKDLGVVTASGVLDRGDIAGHESLAQAEELGRRIQ